MKKAANDRFNGRQGGRFTESEGATAALAAIARARAGGKAKKEWPVEREQVSFPKPQWTDWPDPAADITYVCPRCQTEVTERFYGPCTACRERMTGQRS